MCDLATATSPASAAVDVALLKHSAPGPAASAARVLPASATFADAKARGIADASRYVLDLIDADDVSPEKAETVMSETLEEWAAHVNPAFLRYRKSVADDFAALEWRDGAPGGCTLIDMRGKEYIDCLGGYGIFNVGRSHPVVVKAVARQLAKQSLHSQELIDPLRSYAASLLAMTLPGDLQYAFFTNSGAESVEGALKFAQLATGRRHFIGVVGAFHGKTMGALSGTSKAVFRKPFVNALLPFTHVPVNDVEALTRAFESAAFTGNEIAGFIVEPVLGEGGIHVCSDEFLRAGRALCDKYGACLIFDEVQSGMGRTGKHWWACQHSGVAPDLLASAKAMGGGVQAAGAVFGTARVWAKYLENPFLFTTTFGGSPVAMAAVIACVNVIQTEGLLDNCAARGDQFLAGLHALKGKYPRVLAAVRGRGLMIGLQFPDDDTGYRFARGAFGKGVLLAGTLVNSRVIRVEPPMTITRDEVDTVLARFEEVLAEVDAEMAAAAAAGAAASAAPAAPAAGAKAAPTGGAGTSPAAAAPGTVRVPAPRHPSAAAAASAAIASAASAGHHDDHVDADDEAEHAHGPQHHGDRAQRFASEASEVPMDFLVALTTTGSGTGKKPAGGRPSTAAKKRAAAAAAASADDAEDAAGDSDDEDDDGGSEVSSVSTSSSEEDDRRFDPRPVVARGALALAVPSPAAAGGKGANVTA